MDEQQKPTVSPVTLFYSYAHEDEPLREQLEKHLRLLNRQGLISEWHDRQILAGEEWARDIDKHLETASIILLLISPDFLASNYCYDFEMQRALERHESGEARVIPIILRPVDWRGAPFEHLHCLPHDGRPITQWNNQDEALVTVAKGLRAVIEQIHTPVARSPSPTPLAPRAPAPLKQQAQPLMVSQDRNRLRMLERVRITWITGVLDHSLHDAARIALGLREEPEALANPWRLVVQEVNHPAQPLPAGTRITEVYDAADDALLILGEPGAGKTTLLLELARDLLNRAQANKSEPIPVVFSLSSWAEKRLPLTRWLVEELNIRYQVPRVLAQRWIDNDQVLLLLDGLDEVAVTQRSECIKAINSYRQAHVLVPVVVCSRSADYLNQVQQLSLQRAVIVQPLTVQQIDDYLVRVGEQVTALRVVLGNDPVLQVLSTTPLMLTILTLVYQGTALDEVTLLGSLEAKQQQLFASYVQHMLKRRSVETRYTPEQTIHWLSSLADRMKRQSQTVFYIERMQPDWLLEPQSARLYRRIALGLPGVLMSGLIGGLIFGLGSGLRDVLTGGILGALLGGLIGRRKGVGSSAEGDVRPWKSGSRRFVTIESVKDGLVGALIFGLVGALIFGPIDQYVGNIGDLPSITLNYGFPYGLFGALIGVFIGLLMRRRKEEIQPAEVVTWSWRNMWRSFVKGSHLRGGLIYGLVGLLLGGWLFGGINWLIGGLVGGLSAWLLRMLVYGLVGGWSSERLHEHNLVTPNEGIRRSARNSVLVGLIGWIGGGLIYGVVSGLVSELFYASTFGSVVVYLLFSGLSYGLLSGLLSGLLGGGLACIQHTVLRLLLWRAGSIPWNYPRFLDFAAERILLRKVGGGYMFIHRLLLDYFASLDTPPSEEAPAALASLQKPDGKE